MSINTKDDDADWYYNYLYWQYNQGKGDPNTQYFHDMVLRCLIELVLYLHQEVKELKEITNERR